MVYAPLVVTDEKDSHAISSEEIERLKGLDHLDDFQYVHCRGIPHRSAHIEIVNSEEKFFVWERQDGRLEIPGGHVDWLRDENRPETYEEAARRETVEELRLGCMWKGETEALDKLRGLLVPVEKVINQIPSSHVNNNEWVAVYRLHWPKDWQDPCKLLHDLAKCKEETKAEGRSARWMSIQEIMRKSLSDPMGINSALRLFLRRRGIMTRVLLSKYFKKYYEYHSKICPDPE